MNRIGGGEGGEEAENKPICRRGLGAGVGALYNSCNKKNKKGILGQEI